MLKKIYNAIVPDSLKWKIREKSPYYQRFLALQQESDAAIADCRAKLDASHQETAEYRAQLETSHRETAECCAKLDASQREAAEYRAKLDASQRETAECRAQLDAKAQEITRLNSEYQAQLNAARQESADRQMQLMAKDQEIIRLDAEYQKQLNSTRGECAEYRTQLNTACQEIAGYQTQLAAKDQEIIRLDAEYQKQLNAAREECAGYRTQLNSACQEIAGYQTQLAAKDQEITRLDAEYQTLLNAAREETAESQRQLAVKNQEIARITADWQKKIQTNYADYQNSLKQILRDPAIREDHVCSICGSLMQFSFSKKILNKYDVSYFACPHCKHVQTEKPYWLGESYQSALSDSDTGQIWRNERNRDVVCAIVHRFLSPQAKVLEYAGGYGLLTRMLRDSGVECFWYDKYAQNVFARHFEDDGTRQYELVLAFEALEHFENPMLELENIFSRGASLIFSEVLLPDLCPNQWWYLCTEHGQHVNFYSLETLQFIAECFHKNLYVHGDVGLLTPLELKPEDFADALDHTELYAGDFRKSARSLTVDDMNAVIKEMQTP